MKNKTKFGKSILLASIAVATFGTIAAGTTYALFTSKAENNVTVSTGKVSILTFVDGVNLYSLSGTTGEVKEFESKTTFTNGGSFAYDTETGAITLEKFTPGDKVEFSIKATNKSNVNINIINSKNSQRGKRSSKYISKVQLVGQEENNKKIKLPINLSTFKQIKSPITKNIRLQNDRSFYNLRKHHSVSQNYDWKIKNNKEKVYEKNDVLHNSKDIKDESKQLRKAATLIQNDYRLFKAIETKNIMILSKKLKPLYHILKANNIKINKIYDTTLLSFNGCRKRKIAIKKKRKSVIKFLSYI